MKLLTKTTLYFFLAMVLLLATTGWYLFRQFSQQLNNRSDQELLADEAQWVDYLSTGISDGTTFILRTKELSIYPVNAPPTETATIEDITGTSLKTNRSMPYRQLSQVIVISGITYQLIIKKSQEQKAVFIAAFTRIMLLVFAGLFFVALLFNWIISQGIWKPFQHTLAAIRTAELQKMHTLRFEKTNTREFNELNTALNEMAGKIQRDYINMKEFTENAAHEMQTPIAVVQSKLELLLQDSNLEDKQLEAVAEASGALSRLGKLNQGLLLLARIENNQYETTENSNLVAVTEKYLRLFSELIKDKHLLIETSMQQAFDVKLHSLLADSLVANLLGNAIKYNYSGGRIIISSTATHFSISNTSALPPIAADRIFKRFGASPNPSSGSNGLGLALVKKIADNNELSIQYHVENGLHHFVIAPVQRRTQL